jgi:hypothetical protein
MAKQADLENYWEELGWWVQVAERLPLAEELDWG